MGAVVGTIPRMPLTVGEVFAGYRILPTLGVGGMGEVYLVAHSRLPRQDALKILPSGPCAISSTGFYGQLPADPMSAWIMLDIGYQQRNGLADYLGFWS